MACFKIRKPTFTANHFIRLKASTKNWNIPKKSMMQIVIVKASFRLKNKNNIIQISAKKNIIFINQS
jgi:hypothetical protein